MSTETLEADAGTEEAVETTASDVTTPEAADPQADAVAEGKPDADRPDTAVPEKYDLKLPEDSGLDDSVVERTAALARELGLSNEHAQKLLDQQVSGRKADFEALKSRAAEWGEQVKADKSLGGANYEKTLANSKRAIDKFGTDSLRTMLNSTGFGNHPEVVAFFNRVGMAMGSEPYTPPGNPASGERSVAKALYPDMND